MWLHVVTTRVKFEKALRHGIAVRPWTRFSRKFSYKTVFNLFKYHTHTHTRKLKDIRKYTRTRILCIPTNNRVSIRILYIYMNMYLNLYIIRIYVNCVRVNIFRCWPIVFATNVHN